MAKVSVTGRNIRALREDVGLTQMEFGEKIGVTITSVSGWETRAIPPSARSLATIAEVFHVSIDDLVNINGYYAKTRGGRVLEPKPAEGSLPVIGAAHAGEPGLAYEGNEGALECPGEYCLDGNFFVQVAGDSMNKCLPDGCYALVDTHREVRTGDIALVKVNGDEATIKRVRLTDGVAILEPDSTNPEHKRRIIDETDPDAPAVRLLGKVVYAVTRL